MTSRQVLSWVAIAAVLGAHAGGAALAPATPEIPAARGQAIGCPSLVAAGDGGAVVVFTDQDPDGPPPGPERVYSRYLSLDGAPAALRALSAPGDLIVTAGAVALANGDILVYWLDLHSFFGQRNWLRYRLLDSHGRPVGPTRTAAEIGDLRRTRLFAIPALQAVAVGDDAVMVWKTSGRPPMAMRLNPRAAASERPRLLDGPSRESTLLAVGSLGGRGLLVAWEEIVDDRRALEVRAFDEDLEALADSTPITSRPRRSALPQVRLEGRNDRFVVVWNVVTEFDELSGFRHRAMQRVFRVEGDPLGPERVIGRDVFVEALSVGEDGSFVVGGVSEPRHRDAFAILYSSEGAALGDPVRLDRHDQRRLETCPAVAWATEGEWWAAWLDLGPWGGGGEPDPEPVRLLRLRRFVRQD